MTTYRGSHVLGAKIDHNDEGVSQETLEFSGQGRIEAVRRGVRWCRDPSETGRLVESCTEAWLRSRKVAIEARMSADRMT